MQRRLLLVVAASILLGSGCGASRMGIVAAQSYEPEPAASRKRASSTQVQADKDFIQAMQAKASVGISKKRGQAGRQRYAASSRRATGQQQEAKKAGVGEGKDEGKGKREGKGEREGKGKQPQPPEPLVVYTGYLRLRVKLVMDAADRITRITEKRGGYIQSLAARVMIIRIPVDRFEEVMAALAEVGEVLARRIKALDVTERFTDLRARLAVAKEARQRLMALLQQVQDVQERLRILQEIKRLSEQIESIESTLTTLQTLLDFSTITIELEPVVERSLVQTQRSPFPWVHALQAHRATVPQGKARMVLPPPKGFVVFDKEDRYRAQASDTTTLRAGVVVNEPRGDDRFWSDAVRFEMAGRDEELVEQGTAGSLAYSIFRSKDLRPRSYLVGVHARGPELFVVECFFPSQESYERHREKVLEALRGFGSR